MNEKINRDQPCYFRKWDLKGCLKSDEKQWSKVIYNGLHDIPDKAGIYGLAIYLLHEEKVPYRFVCLKASVRACGMGVRCKV